MGIGSIGSLYIGVSGLQVGQNALNTTAHNLANVDTKGYSRQQILLNDSLYVNLNMQNNNNIFQVGTGSQFSTVRTVRDTFLDVSFREETGRLGFYQARYDALSDAESYFDELEGSTFSDCIQDLWESVNQLNNESKNITYRGALVESSVALVDRANKIYQHFVDYQTNLNSEILKKVDKINTLAEQINGYNNQIMKYEASGVESANDLRDKRNAALDELSTLIDISVKENTNGVVLVSAENVQLVGADRTFKMGVAKVSEGSELLKPVWTGHGDVDVFDFSRIPNSEADTDVGQLKGLLMARGDTTPNYTNIPIAPEKPVQPNESDYSDNESYNDALTKYQEDLAQYNIDLGTYNANVDQYNSNIEPYGMANLIAEFDQLMHGIVTKINDILCPNKTVDSDITLNLADGSTYTISAGTKILDVDNAPIGNGEGNDYPGTELFSRKGVDRYTKITDENGQEYYIYNEENPDDKYSLYTVGEIEVNPDVIENYSIIPLSKQDGGENQEVLSALSSVWSEPFAKLNPNTLVDSTFKEYYQAMIDELANKANGFNKLTTTQTTTVAGLENQRQQMIGVSSDEELTNMIMYQHAYNASSRYISVVSEMLEHLIEKLG